MKFLFKLYLFFAFFILILPAIIADLALKTIGWEPKYIYKLISYLNRIDNKYLKEGE